MVSALWELLPEPVWDVLGGRNPGAWMGTEWGPAWAAVCAKLLLGRFREGSQVPTGLGRV